MDIIDVLVSEIPDKHIPAFHGDPNNYWSVNRWRWTCRCGINSKLNNMTIKEAQQDYNEHKI